MVGRATNTTPMYYKAVFDLKLPPAVKVGMVEDFLTKMPLISTFDDPPIPYSEANETLDLLKLRLAEAAQGGVMAKQLRAEAVKATNALIKTYKDFVTVQARGNKTVVLSSGFKATKEPTPVGHMDDVEILKAKMTGKSGEAKLRWKLIRGCQFYEVDYMTGNATEWSTICTTSVFFLLTGLTPYMPNKVRVRAKGAAGYGGYSNTIEFIVL